MTDKLKGKYKRKAIRALFMAQRGGLEGVAFPELIAYLRVKHLLDRGYSIGLTTAQLIGIIRKCQGEMAEQFVEDVMVAVEELVAEGCVVINEYSIIFLTGKGRRAYTFDENQRS